MDSHRAVRWRQTRQVVDARRCDWHRDAAHAGDECFRWPAAERLRQQRTRAHVCLIKQGGASRRLTADDRSASLGETLLGPCLTAHAPDVSLPEVAVAGLPPRKYIAGAIPRPDRMVLVSRIARDLLGRPSLRIDRPDVPSAVRRLRIVRTPALRSSPAITSNSNVPNRIRWGSETAAFITVRFSPKRPSSGAGS